MPALIFGILVLGGGTWVSRNILKGLAALFAVSTYVKAKKYEKMVWAAKLNFNTEKEKWEEGRGVSQPLAHYQLSLEDLPHKAQTWAIGDYIFYEAEWLQFWEFLEVDAANREAPGSRWTGIDGPWLKEIGNRRWGDEEVRSLLYQEENE